MSFTIKHELSSPTQIVATTENYTIVINRDVNNLQADFEITWTTTGQHAFGGGLGITETSSFFFEQNPESTEYIYAQFGNEFFQFKQEEYGIVIDAFNSEGEALTEYGYTMDEDFEDDYNVADISK